MEFVGNINELNKEPLAKLVYEKLTQIIADDKAILHYKFPFYKGDIREDTIEAKLLLLSPAYGIYFFDLDARDGFDDVVKNRVDSLYNEISSLMKKYAELRSGRDKLKYDVYSIIIGNQKWSGENEDYILATVDDIPNIVSNFKPESPIEESLFLLISSCISGTTTLIQKKKRPISKPDTKAAVLNDIQNHIASFDIDQMRVAEVDIDAPQRIRGLAGSGKTIILAYKAALFHARYPQSKILYTFYTKSLADTVKKLIERAYRHYAINKVPNWDVITVCHGWGSSSSEGVYYNACKSNNYTPMSFIQARQFSGSKDAFAYICKDLAQKELQPEYDLILIDEGQDFPIEFYQLCYKLCKTKRICWAYDEFQNIFDVTIQDERVTFGNDENGKPLVDFGEGNILQDIPLKKCYRTPRLSLISAFALGLGIYNEKVLQRLESNQQWEALGFKVLKGSSNTGDDMVIERPLENTPSYSNERFTKDSINIGKFKNLDDECVAIARYIGQCISVEGLIPTDICVICLDSKYIAEYFSKIENLLHKNGISTFNHLNAPYSNTRFFIDNRVTLSTVNKAKGNECGVVFICGADAVFRYPNDVILRDKLFTSMTRTKGWLFLSGVGDSIDIFSKEYNELVKNKFNLVFKQPDKEETKNIENVSRSRDNAESIFANQIKKMRELGMSDDELQKMWMELLKIKK